VLRTEGVGSEVAFQDHRLERVEDAEAGSSISFRFYREARDALQPPIHHNAQQARHEADIQPAQPIGTVDLPVDVAHARKLALACLRVLRVVGEPGAREVDRVDEAEGRGAGEGANGDVVLEKGQVACL
jgi:hypothetical protein